MGDYLTPENLLKFTLVGGVIVALLMLTSMQILLALVFAVISIVSYLLLKKDSDQA